jgi:CDGSH-type Zn-finger protein
MSAPARITPYRDGPLIIRGPFTLTDQDGTVVEISQDTIALCRCGQSQRKPFCDGTHNAINFRADSRPQDWRAARDADL